MTPDATPEPIGDTVIVGSQENTGSQGVWPDEAPDEALEPEPENQNSQQDITDNTGPNKRVTPYINLPRSSEARETPMGQSRARRDADISLDQNLIVQGSRTRKKSRKVLENKEIISFLASFYAG